MRLSEKKRPRTCWTIPTSLPKGIAHPGYLPVRLFMLMEIMTRAFEWHGSYSNVDLFAGQRSISKAYAAKGLGCCALDIALDPRDDT